MHRLAKQRTKKYQTSFSNDLRTIEHRLLIVFDFGQALIDTEAPFEYFPFGLFGPLSSSSD